MANLPEFEQLREIGRDIKNHTLANLDFYLEAYEAKVLAAGGKVHWCSTPDDARAVVLEICRKAGARTVTKGKSMISEELGINAHLEANGIQPGRDRSRRIHPAAPRGAPEPHHRPRLPPQPGRLGGRFPPRCTPISRPTGSSHERRDILAEARTRLREKFLRPMSASPAPIS